MVFSCCIKGCKTTGTMGLHSFPSNPEVAKIWIQATGNLRLTRLLDIKTLSHSYNKVCYKHFKEEDFFINLRNQRCLKRDTIPSVLLTESHHSNKIPEQSEAYRKIVVRGCVHDVVQIVLKCFVLFCYRVIYM